MPTKSEAQRKYLYAIKGAAWVKAHGFDTKGKLPKHVKKTKAKTRPKDEEAKRPLVKTISLVRSPRP